MQRSAYLFLFLLLAAGGMQRAHAQAAAITDRRIARGSKVFIRTVDHGEYLHLAHLLEYSNYWQLTDQPSAADFILHVRSTPGWNYRAYAVLEDPRTGEAFARTGTVNTFWTSSSFNYKLGAMRKLFRKQLHRKYMSRS